MRHQRLSTAELESESKRLKSAILTMTTLAKSGHPGGSMSSMDILLALYQDIDVWPENYTHMTRDRVVVSHGHISPAVYAVLSQRGFVRLEDAICQYRVAGSHFEGHIESEIPGIEWATGNLGQGLSVATGFALESKIRGIDNQIYCLMGDGEQQKGQIAEARRFAIKYGLKNLTAIIDYNKLQICGKTEDVMPQNIRENYISDGWAVLEINGHDFDEIFDALTKAREIDAPVLILANTIMGCGVSFMEHREKYHGSPISESDLVQAYKELSFEYPYQELAEKRKQLLLKGDFTRYQPTVIKKNKFYFFVNNEKVYTTPVDNRSAWGDAIADIARLNTDKLSLSDDVDHVPIAVFDCDLQGSVKTAEFEKLRADTFFQAGIMEHHTVVCAGALSRQRIQTFFANFGVFGIDETYNQHRLNDINHANLKVVLTHVGLDVGEDGKTHQCIDYIGTLSNIFGARLIVPADPNQTYKAVNFLAQEYGNYFLAMGRSKVDIIKKENGDIFFGKDYSYIYGAVDVLREGMLACMFVTGSLAVTAIQVIDELRSVGLDIRLVHISSPHMIPEHVVSEAVETGLVFSCEDHHVQTGLGAIVASTMVYIQKVCPLRRFGVNDYACSGAAEDVYKLFGLDAHNLKIEILKELQRHGKIADSV